MITSDLAKECLEEFEMLISNIHNKTAYEYLNKYITQQEKRDELLEWLKIRLNQIVINAMGDSDNNAKMHLLMYIFQDGQGITKLDSEKLVGDLIRKLLLESEL